MSSKTIKVVPLLGTLVLAPLAFSCGQSDIKSPAISLGAPNIKWADKNEEQKFGFMAAAVHPVMKELFVEYDDSYDEFACATCHGDDAELIDYRMPSDYLFSLPAENAIAESMDYDEEVTDFMLSKVVPELQKMFDQGHGSPTKASCFSCHPTE